VTEESSLRGQLGGFSEFGAALCIAAQRMGLAVCVSYSLFSKSVDLPWCPPLAGWLGHWSPALTPECLGQAGAAVPAACQQWPAAAAPLQCCLHWRLCCQLFPQRAGWAAQRQSEVAQSAEKCLVQWGQPGWCLGACLVQRCR